MGKHGRAIVEISLKEIVKDLQRAYADEWLAFYLYWYIGKTVTGRMYQHIQALMEKLAAEELEHAQELAGHITTMGDVPPSNPTEFDKVANFPYIAPPKNTADLNRIIRIVQESEANAIDVYARIAKKTSGKDHLTYQLVTHILAEEVNHEDIFENLQERS